MTRILLPLRSPILARWLGHDERVPVRALGVVFAIIALVLLGVALVRTLESRSELQETQRALADARERLAREHGMRGARRPQLTKDQLIATNAVIRQLNVPWPDIFDALERRTPGNVALVSIEPDSKRNAIRIEAEAKRADELLAYAEQLERDPAIAQVVLIRHDTRDASGTPVARMSIDAWLAPANARLLQARSR